VKKEGKFFTMEEEIVDKKIPALYHALCWLKGIPFVFIIEERFLRAGNTSTDSVATLTLCRWQVVRLLDLLVEDSKTDGVIVYLLQAWDAERIGTLTIPEELSTPYMLEDAYMDIEKDVAKLAQGGPGKTGAILCGPPGNGKSYLVRYFALKYGLSIYLVPFTPDLNNMELIRMFSNIKGPCIVLFEDFDSYFNGKKCLLRKAAFTYDVLLNILDGVFSTHVGVSFFMTVNDLSKVDEAMRTRPSRFKYIKEIDVPSKAIRSRVFENRQDKEMLVKATEGLNLDSILAIQSQLEQGYSVSDLALSKKLRLIG